MPISPRGDLKLLGWEPWPNSHKYKDDDIFNYNHIKNRASTVAALRSWFKLKTVNKQIRLYIKCRYLIFFLWKFAWFDVYIMKGWCEIESSFYCFVEKTVQLFSDEKGERGKIQKECVGTWTKIRKSWELSWYADRRQKWKYGQKLIIKVNALFFVQLEPKLNPKTGLDHHISHGGSVFDHISHGGSTKNFYLASSQLLLTHRDHIEQIPIVTVTFVQVTIVNISNMSAVTDLILTKL